MNASNNEEDDDSEKGKNFKFASSNGLLFQREKDGKIKCGKCNKVFIWIIFHLKNACQGAIPLSELEKLKQELDKLNKKERQRKWTCKVKSESPRKFEGGQLTKNGLRKLNQKVKENFETITGQLKRNGKEMQSHRLHSNLKLVRRHWKENGKAKLN